jgi:hypothetical protein
MDKFPTIHDVWRSALPWGVAWLIFARINPVTILAILVLPNSAISMLSEVIDTNMGSAIRQEAGSGYVQQVYLANAYLLGCYAIGVVWWWLARKKRLSGGKDDIETS